MAAQAALGRLTVLLALLVAVGSLTSGSGGRIHARTYTTVDVSSVSLGRRLASPRVRLQR